MLKSLAVENFTVIERVRLEFSGGMSTITGETGAGKSILIGALGLALGQRAQSHHPGDGKLSVTLEVEVGKLPAVRTWLEEHDLDGDECILRRTLTYDGRSRAFINGTQMPLAQLQGLSGKLVEIVGQNTQQSLMQPGNHLGVLDLLCDHGKTLDELRETQQQWNALSKRLEERLRRGSELEDRAALLNYQVRELETFAPTDGEYAEVDRAHRRLSKKELLREEATKALALLDEDDGRAATDAATQISEATRALQQLADTDAEIGAAREQLEAALDNVQNASREIRSCLERVEVSEEEYRRLEKRLEGYLDLSRKYNVRPEALTGHLADLQRALAEIENPEADPEEMERRLAELQVQYTRIAERVSKRRKATAAALSKQVTQTLGELNMQGARFSVEFTLRGNDAPHPRGREQAEFFVRTNPGQAPGPLARIASGGELARVSLAIQAAFAAKSPVPTLVFDEVDAGVGGKTAEMVGRLLKKISRDTQVFCITHLPQIAVQADHHFMVGKREEGGRTQVEATELSDEQRRQEVARMVAGAEITEKSLAHAGEMLERKVGETRSL